jgi:hypothetical protein
VSNTGDLAPLGAITQVLTNVAGASANPFDYTATAGIMDGSDDLTIFDLNLTNADHTGSTNTVQAIDIAGITADAHAVESAMKFGAGWDSDLNFTTSGELAVDGTVMVTVKDPPSADSAATTEYVEIAGTAPLDTTGTNVHDFLTIDVAVSNSSGGTNSVRGLQVDGITGDAQITETGVNIGSGWDSGLTNASPTTLSGAVGLDGAVTASSTFAQTLVNTAGASANPYDYTGTLGIMDGSDDFTLFDVNVTNADHSSTGNTVQVLDVANITGDADATEVALQVGTGWDYGMSSASPVLLSSTVEQTLTNGAGASANPWDYTATAGIMDGSDSLSVLDINLTNANHTGTAATNTVRAVDIAGMTADANAYENAIYFGAGWDSDLDAQTSLELAVDDVVVVTLTDPAGADSGNTNEMLEVAGTTPIDTSGTNIHNFVTIDAAIGDSSAGTNSVRGVQVDNITGDAQVTETGVHVGTGWDYGADFDSPVNVDAAFTSSSTIAQTLTNVAGASANPYDYTATAGIMDGSDDLTILDINLTNADYTGFTNTVQALDISAITGDAHATETAVNVGSGWDVGLASASPVQFTAALNYLMDVSIVTTDTVLTAAESGTMVVLKNQDTFPVVVTLPAAAAGLNFCFNVLDGDDVSVDAPDADQIQHYTNATSDDVENSTAGDWICLVAIDDTDWVAYSAEGTWTDD